MVVASCCSAGAVQGRAPRTQSPDARTGERVRFVGVDLFSEAEPALRRRSFRLWLSHVPASASQRSGHSLMSAWNRQGESSSSLCRARRAIRHTGLALHRRSDDRDLLMGRGQQSAAGARPHLEDEAPE